MDILKKAEELIDEVEEKLGLQPSFPSAMLPPADQRLQHGEEPKVPLGDPSIVLPPLDETKPVEYAVGTSTVSGGVNGDGI